MGGNDPARDVEQRQPAAHDVEAAEVAAISKDDSKVAKPKPEGAFKRFISGPYFDVIPPQYERVAHATPELAAAAAAAAKNRDGKAAVEEPPTDYMGRLKDIVMNPVDVDDIYGLTRDELVPLPFDVPKWHAYLVDILSGVYLVENQERAWKSGRTYTRSWLPLIKALIIIYPLITLIILVSFTVDYAIRKFMYFRLLSMRILVDWKNNEPWRTVFFYYFVGTWAIMNAWAIYGVAKYYNKDGNKGVDPVSFGTFVVVNLQTIQLLLYYFKLLSTESRLVSLNQIFERAPVEAQRLLEFTYVIEEEDLIDETYMFALNMQRVFFRRLLNIMTCCLAAKDWHEAEKNVRFDIERLKRRAPNYREVERNVRELRHELQESGYVSPAKARTKTPEKGAAKSPGGEKEVTPTKQQQQQRPEGERDGVVETEAEVRSPEQMRLEVGGDTGVAAAAAVSAAVAAAAAAAEQEEERGGGGGGSSGKAKGSLSGAPSLGPEPRPTFPPETLSLCGFRPLRWAYSHCYASLHSLHVAVMVSFPSWPFRPDTPYFRMLTLIQLVGIFGVGAIVVLGWVFSTSNTNCNKATKTCNTCLSVQERYFSSDEPLCTSFETAIANIVSSANGTWLNNGVLQQRYCNWACYGNFTPSPASGCPALS
ncbi:hypothetical protein PLESTM_000859500 [Pleodorina starrii]|nr:hypothetical protein PLESTM_000859500 [Pleodorina starrii]